MSQNAVITHAKRTPIGSFQGVFSDIPAPKLGAAVIQNILKDSGIKPELVDECIMGNVLTAGLGQAPARQAAIFGGLPNSVRCMTINKVCGSGLKAIMLASDSIRLGHAKIVVAGGQENMTLAPHIIEKSRSGFRMGPVTLQDSMVLDGLWDPYNNFHMGNAAELCVKEYGFTREAQDEFAVLSYKKAQEAASKGYFKNEIVAVEGGREKKLIDIDEEPGRARFDKIPTLKPAFDKTGSVTAANASKLNDGAAACLVMSEDAAIANHFKPLVRIKAQATFAQAPEWFTTAPVAAIKKVLEIAQLKTSDIDLWEINEAFSAVTMAAIHDLKIPPASVNIHGGAVALGHPIGASGARILATLIHALKMNKARYGLATLCIGGGEAVALIVETVQ